METCKVLAFRSPQTITTLGLTKLVDLIVGDSNAGAHLRGSGAQISVSRTNTDSSALADLVIAAPHADTDGVVTTSDVDYTAEINWEWRDTSDTAYNATGGKFYAVTPAANQELMTASSWALASGDTGNDKLAAEVGTFRWELVIQHPSGNRPSALQTEIEAGAKVLADAIVDSSAAHLTSSTIYAFFGTSTSGTPAREASPVSDATASFDFTETLVRNRATHPHQFVVNVDVDVSTGVSAAATGLYLGVGSISDNPRKIIYGERFASTQTISGTYNVSLTFDFSDA